MRRERAMWRRPCIKGSPVDWNSYCTTLLVHEDTVDKYMDAVRDQGGVEGGRSVMLFVLKEVLITNVGGVLKH